MMVSVMILLIPADINVWLGHKQESKGQPASAILLTNHMVDSVMVVLIPESSGQRSR